MVIPGTLLEAVKTNDLIVIRDFKKHYINTRGLSYWYNLITLCNKVQVKSDFSIQPHHNWD